jgi:hypothetical protein
MKRLALLAGLALYCCGPGYHVEHVLIGAPRAPSGGPVRVSMQGQPYPNEFAEIAILQGAGSDLDTVMSAMQVDAQNLGCSAMINVRVDQGAALAVSAVCAVEKSVPPLPAASAAPH